MKQLIINIIGTQNADKLNQDPEIGRGDALAGPPVDAAPAGQNIENDDTQTFPFYGVVTVRSTR